VQIQVKGFVHSLNWERQVHHVPFGEVWWISKVYNFFLEAFKLILTS